MTHNGKAEVRFLAFQHTIGKSYFAAMSRFELFRILQVLQESQLFSLHSISKTKQCFVDSVKVILTLIPWAV